MDLTGFSPRVAGRGGTPGCGFHREVTIGTRLRNSSGVSSALLTLTILAVDDERDVTDLFS